MHQPLAIKINNSRVREVIFADFIRNFMEKRASMEGDKYGGD
jgi:hypothetical protein